LEQAGSCEDERKVMLQLVTGACAKGW